ncbi:MAG TPA: helix-turn-helix transcriptional regulator [Phycisphaerae bacterium]|nr:helix-turn-helix transcriptional regulator [Phycisphaerales bacterium]HRX85993.1 helix-turn-helix transcriptional regulator [Phycisphaerae bacterium]
MITESRWRLVRNPMPISARPDMFPELLTDVKWLHVEQAYRLTGQELTALRLLCRGYSNQQLAEHLGIALPTVRSHLRALYRKFDRRDRIGVLLELIHLFADGDPVAGVTRGAAHRSDG